ncbi:MAG: hypothetical protein PVG60_02520, partial [Desulfarculaceae bacterium]
VVGQTYELSLPLPEQGILDQAGLNALLRAFSELYRQRYAFFFEGEAIELVNLRVSALGVNQPLQLPTASESGADPAPAFMNHRPVYFEKKGWLDSAVYQRSRLCPGMAINGPAVVEEETSSSLVPPEARAQVAGDFGLIIPLNRTREPAP